MRAPRNAPCPSAAAKALRDLPLGILRATDGRIDLANPAASALLGRTVEALLGLDLFELFSPPDRVRLQEHARPRAAGDEQPPGSVELQIHRPDGTRACLEVELSQVEPRQLLAQVRDAKSRKRDTGLLAALAEVELNVQRGRTLEAVLDAAQEGLVARGLHLVLARREDGCLVIERAALMGTQLAQLVGRLLRGLRIREDRLTLFPQAARERRMIFASDEALPAFVPMVHAMRPDLSAADIEASVTAGGFSRCVVCPLVVDGEVWGMLGVASGSLTRADAETLGLFASKVASAIEGCGTIQRLERRNRELAAVQEVAAAGSEPSLDALLAELLRIATRSFTADAAAIYLLDETRASLELAATTGTARVLAEHFKSCPLDVAAVGQTFVQLKAVAVDVAVDLPAQARALALGAGVHHVAVVPLHIKGRLAGGLAMGRSAARPFGTEELRAAELLADQMAIQVEKARLYADASRRLHQLRTLFDLTRIGTGTLEVKTLVDRVLEQAMGALAVDGAAIHIIEGGRLLLSGQCGSGPPEQDVRQLPCDGSNLLGRAVCERRTIQAGASSEERNPSTGRPQLAIAAPLIAKDRVLGTLLVGRSADQPFETEESRLLEAFAAQVGAALDQVRSFEEERRRVEELKLFLEVGRVVTASLDLDQILDSAAESLARIADATDCFILLLDSDRRVLRGAAASCPAFREPFRSARIALEDRAAAAHAVRTGQPVRIPDARASEVGNAELIAHFRLKSLLALPLAVRDQSIGAVAIGDQRHPRAWSEAQIERATVVARQVAVAVANARLYEDLKHSYDQLARAQAELVKRERLAALGELAAVMAHEVRNPLGVIFNSLRSLKKVLRPVGDAAMLLDIVEEEADRLNCIVGDLLDFARPSEPSLQTEQLGAVLTSAAEAARATATASGVRIVIETPEPLPRAAVDARMLRQALLNLVINAIQAMPKGGTVTLRATEEHSLGGGKACIEVSDTGPGIPPDLAERVFEPFFTTKAAGTGLGLAVVKRIVEAHRGEVTLSSKPGLGAHFSLRLPLTNASAASTNGPP